MAQDDPNIAVTVLENVGTELRFQKPSRDSQHCEMLRWVRVTRSGIS